jgi:uncharacterized protein (TIGR02246 family)
MGHDKEVPTADDLAARRLIARYAQLVDDGDLAVAAELFEPDGRVVMDGQEHRGRDAVRAWLGEVTVFIAGTPSQHQMTNVVVSYGSHPDTAHAVSDLSLIVKGEAGWVVLATGRYHDTFAGHGREMRFRQRLIRLV